LLDKMGCWNHRYPMNNIRSNLEIDTGTDTA